MLRTLCVTSKATFLLALIGYSQISVDLQHYDYYSALGTPENLLISVCGYIIALVRHKLSFTEWA